MDALEQFEVKKTRPDWANSLVPGEESIRSSDFEFCSKFERELNPVHNYSEIYCMEIYNTPKSVVTKLNML